MEGGAGPGHGDPLPAEHVHGPHGVEHLDDDVRTAGEQARAQPDGPGHVGEREGQRPAVPGPEVEAGGHASGGRDDRGVGVLRALGVGGRSRRVEQPAHGREPGVGGDLRRRRQGCRVALRERPVAHHHLGPPAVELGDAAGHGLVVEVAPAPRHDEHGHSRLGRDEADLALAVDGDDRVLHHRQARQRSGQDQRLVPGREHPRHHLAGPDTTARQARGRPLGCLLVTGERDPPAVLVDCHLLVGARRCPALDQLPQRPRVRHLHHSRSV